MSGGGDVDLRGGEEGIGGGAAVVASSSSSSSSAHSADDARCALLRRMRRVLARSYVERYLTFVRSIFLVLDRA